MNNSDRDALVLENLPLVGFITWDVYSRSRHIDRQELASAGFEALVRAADSFDAVRGVPFGAYARQRIRGALIDEIRKNEWHTRSAVKRMKDNRDVRELLASTLNRNPTIDEMAAALGVDRSEVEEGMADEARSLTHIDETVETTVPAVEANPEEAALSLEEKGFLTEAVAALPENLRRVVEQLYFEDRTVKEIAAEQGCSSSAISQRRTEALRLIKDAIGERDTIGDEMTARISANRRESYLASVRQSTQGGLAGLHGARTVMSA